MLDFDTADARAASEPLEAAARQTLRRLQPGGAHTAASRFRVSRYDMTVRLADGASLLFNSRTRSLILLSAEESVTYAGLAARGPFGGGEVADTLFLQSLIGGGHLVGETVDEVAAVRADYEAARGATGVPFDPGHQLCPDGIQRTGAAAAADDRAGARCRPAGRGLPGSTRHV